MSKKIWRGFHLSQLDTPSHLHYTGIIMALKKPWLLLIVTALVSILAACTPPTPPPSPTPWPSDTPIPVAVETRPPTQAPPTATNTAVIQPTATATPTRAPLLPTEAPSATTITVWVPLPQAQLQQLTEDIVDFQARFPQYVVEVEQYADPQAFMRPLMSGESKFDVVLASPVLLSSLWAAEKIAPMSNFFPPSFIDSFSAATLQGALKNGELWALPETSGFHLLLFYNKELVDTPPTNTADMAEMAQNLTNNSQWGLGLNSFDPLWVLPWLVPQSSRLIDENGYPTLNTPAMVNALTLFQEWHQEPTQIAPKATYEEAQTKFLAGDIAMMINGDWAIGELTNARDIEWGVAPLPAVGSAEENQPAVPLVLSKYWAVSNTATEERALAASTFLEFITRPERQQIWAAKFNQLPTRRQALNDPLIVNDPIRRISATQMQAGRPIPLGLNANLLLDAMREPLQNLVNGKLTPQEAAEQMQANLEE